MQVAERRRDLERALAYPINGMTARAIVQGKGLAAIFGRRGGERRCDQQQRENCLVQHGSQHGGTISFGASAQAHDNAIEIGHD